MSSNNKRKCPSCDHTVTAKTAKIKLGIFDPETGAELIGKSRSFSCKKCGYSWMTPTDTEKLEEQITKATWRVLKPSEIAEIRQAMGFKTKTQAAKFLGLNHKAFSKWE